jgi:dTDP-D-glucose 4,6-dehydratase
MRYIKMEVVVLSEFKNNMITFFDELIDQFPDLGELVIMRIFLKDQICIKDVIEIIAAIMGTSVNIKSTAAPEGETKRRCPDITKIKKLGYSPKVNLQAGLKSTIEWYCSNN